MICIIVPFDDKPDTNPRPQRLTHSTNFLFEVVMGDIGFPELMVILVIALVFFGGGKLPEAGRSMGQAIREFKKGMRDLPVEAEVVKAKDTEKSTQV